MKYLVFLFLLACVGCCQRGEVNAPVTSVHSHNNVSDPFWVELDTSGLEEGVDSLDLAEKPPKDVFKLEMDTSGVADGPSDDIYRAEMSEDHPFK